jgi:hypothetical protein
MLADVNEMCTFEERPELTSVRRISTKGVRTAAAEEIRVVIFFIVP